MVDELAGHRVVSHAGSLGHFTAHLIMVPEADGLGIAVVTNASAFIAAGHEGQYDISIGLTRMLLGEEAARARYDPLLVYAAPLVLWGLALALLATIIHTVGQTLRQPRHGMARPTRSRRFCVGRVILPSVGYVVAATVVLLTVPLGAARHFYPDAATALTLLTYLCLGWGVLRLPLTLHRDSRRTPVAAAEAAGGNGTPAICATGPSR
jgi:hypothetical protein